MKVFIVRRDFVWTGVIGDEIKICKSLEEAENVFSEWVEKEKMYYREEGLKFIVDEETDQSFLIYNPEERGDFNTMINIYEEEI